MRRLRFLWYALCSLLAAPLSSCSGREKRASQTNGGGRASVAGGGMMGGGMMSGSGMMGAADSEDMRLYMDLFDNHSRLRRRVEQIPGGIRTVTESDDSRLAGLLQGHVAKMYRHVAEKREVRCMSDSLPTMFRNADRYHRRLTLTPKGVAIEETSTDAELTAAIRAHAREVSSFVKDGMPAMMQQMMR